MSEIEKIRILHDLKGVFSVDELTLAALSRQIGSDLRRNLGRFYAGYTAEDNCMALWSCLPWTKLIHGLGQLQMPEETKADYQVPDFMAIVEISVGTSSPLLVEVKQAGLAKHSIELMKKQCEALRAYASDVRMPVLIATYWPSMGLWTANALDVFESKASTYKLKWDIAIKYDLSLIFGDIAFVVPETLRRRSTFDSALHSPDEPYHEKYGQRVADEVSLNGIDFVAVRPIESAALDASVGVKESSRSRSGTRTTIDEVANASYVLKLSTIVHRHVGLFESALSLRAARFSTTIVWALFTRLGAQQMRLRPPGDRPVTKGIADEFLGHL